jgi:hypothetical protein
MPSLVIDKSNKPHIAWADNSSGNYEIYYLYWNGNAWVDVSGNGQALINVCNNNGTSIYPSLALDNFNRPNIAWQDNTLGNNAVFYRYWNGTNWATLNGKVDVSDIQRNSYEPSLCLDSNNMPHIAWEDKYGTSNIFYLKWDGSNWVDADGIGQENINVSYYYLYDDTDSFKFVRLKIDKFNNPHIVFCVRSILYGAFHIVYKKWNGSAFVDAEGNTPTKTIYSLPNFQNVEEKLTGLSFTLDKNDLPGISWTFYLTDFNDSFSFISYKKWNGYNWVGAPETNCPNYEFYSEIFCNTDIYINAPSLAFNSFNSPCIAWQDWTDNNEIFYLQLTYSETVTITYSPTVTTTYSPTVTTTYSPTVTITYSPTVTVTLTMTPTMTISQLYTITLTPTQIFTLTPTHTITNIFIPTEEALILLLKGNNPNPVEENTKLIYWLSKNADIEIKIWTVSGEEVFKEKIKGYKGMNAYLWNGKNKNNKKVATGVYIYKIIAKTPKEKKEELGKIIVIR